MYNFFGNPAFGENEGHTANPSCYEIDSKNDFTPEEHFLMGMAAPDADGRMVPTASVGRRNLVRVIEIY